MDALTSNLINIPIDGGSYVLSADHYFIKTITIHQKWMMEQRPFMFYVEYFEYDPVEEANPLRNAPRNEGWFIRCCGVDRGIGDRYVEPHFTNARTFCNNTMCPMSWDSVCPSEVKVEKIIRKWVAAVESCDR